MSKILHTLFSLFIILITSCNANHSSNTSSSSSTLCPISYCGNVSIHYPFWIKSQTIKNTTRDFCGYPNFGLECSENQTIINLPSDTYYVTNINYDNNTITLVDIDILDQKCPRARKNVTLSNLPLSFSSLDLNLSFYFNCSSYPSYVDPIGCFSNNEKLKSYVLMAGDEAEGYNWNCEQHVVVIVKNDELNDVVGSVAGLINGFGSAMKKGFVLDWRKDEDCAMCEISGGYCGFDQNNKKSTCICGNGSVVARSCKKEPAY